METIGVRIRRQRRRLGLTLDDLAGRTGISKPYLSLIETGRVANPPSDEKVRRLEQSLGFTSGDLLTQAHLQRTPRDVRAVLGKLLAGDRKSAAALLQSTVQLELKPSHGSGAAGTSAGENNSETSADGEAGFLSEALRGIIDPGHLDQLNAGAIPVINRAAAPYPNNFRDLSFPSHVAEQFIACPDVADKDAFAARVHGDAMTPKYAEGDVVIFSPAMPPRNGDDCFVSFADGQTTFSRIFFESDAGDKGPVIRLQPRNERHRAAIVPGGKISGLYRAVYRYQRVGED
jgi:transcriptional regulator with XRE-family HTH domain